MKNKPKPKHDGTLRYPFRRFMTDGLERIEKLFQEFRSKVAHCRDKDLSDMADIQDAYSRLNRLRDRYRYEASTLNPTERAALRRVFEDDEFIEGMGKVRVIGDHVERGGAVLRHTNNSPFTITSESSAAAVGCGSLRLPT
jgi:hypothetical protein